MRIGGFVPSNDVPMATSSLREWGVMSLSPALPSAANGIPEAFDLTVADVHVREAEQGGDRVLRRAREVGANDVGEHVVARLLGGGGRVVHVAWAILLVPDQLLLLENPEDGAHGRVGGRIGEILHDLGDGRAVAPMEDV